MLRKCAKHLWWFLRLITPKGQLGDMILSPILFTFHQGRLPNRKMWFNDVIYRIKISKELEHPVRVFTSDKDLLKIYVAGVAGPQYNVPTLAVLRTQKDIDEYDFPKSCVIKPTQGAAKVIIRRNGEPIDREEIKSWLYYDYYKRMRERNYAPLIPKIIVEPIIFEGTPLIDYKIFCYNGKAKYIQTDCDRHTNHNRLYYSLDWQSLDFTMNYQKSEKLLPKPKLLNEMIELAEKLSAHLSLVRIDLYTNDKDILVGEMTHCNGSGGGEQFTPPEKEQEISALLFGNETNIYSDAPEPGPKNF